MAFQVGTRVDPRLGALDFSGFTNAANIQAQTIAQLGATIGGAIQVAGEKKKEKALSKQAQDMVFGMLKKEPAQADFFGLPEDFTLADVKPIVDVIGPKPTIALMTQLNMASMKDTTKRPSVKDAQNFQEYLATIGGGKDLILKNGMLYDEDFGPDDLIPKDDPIVQQLLKTEEGQQFLTGYNPPTFLGTTGDDGTPASTADDADTAVINMEPEPTGSRLMRLGGKAIDAKAFLQDAGTTIRSIPLATLNFLLSGDSPAFSESLDFARPKMETLRDIGLARNPYEAFSPMTRAKEFAVERLSSE